MNRSLMTICPSCNASVGLQDVFCGTCGTALPPASATQADLGAVTTVRTCDNCGREVADTATICPACSYELVDEVARSVPSTAPSIVGGRPVIPGTSIALGDGETVWRQYWVTGFPPVEILGVPITRTDGKGTLYVTDSRLLFFATFRRRGSTRSSVLIQETQLEHVTGLSAYVSHSFSLFAVVAVALLGIAGVSGLANGSTLGGLLLLTAGIVGAMLLAQGFARRGTVGLRVSSAAAQVSPLGFGEIGDPRRGLLRALLGPFGPIATALMGPRDATDMLMALPARDAEQVIFELGALVTDLQSKGTLAETHWGRDADHGFSGNATGASRWGSLGLQASIGPHGDP